MLAPSYIMANTIVMKLPSLKLRPIILPPPDKIPQIITTPHIPIKLGKLALPPPPPPPPLPRRQIIELYPPQVDHVDRLKKISMYSPVVLDFSMLGTGKTFTSSYIALESAIPSVVVVCPPSLEHRWADMKSRYGVPIVQIISYNSIRSTKCHQPRHGYLSRYDYKETVTDKNGRESIVDKVDFDVTDDFKKLVATGCYIILDEVQHIRNINDQFHACQALIRHVTSMYEGGCRSRVFMLSGSPIDRKEQVIHLYRMIGIMKSDNLSQYNPYTGKNVWKGFGDIINYARRFDPHLDTNYSIPPENEGIAKNFSSIAYDIFQNLIKAELVSAMLPFKSNVKINKYNGFYDIKDEQDVSLLASGVDMLAKSSRYDEATGTVDFRHHHNEEDGETTGGISLLAKITQALQMIETAKIGTIARIVRERLTVNPTMKIVVGVNYIDTINDLKDELEDYNPLILTGSVPKARRGEIVEKFQHPSTTHRLIIGNISVLGTGIDLDDQHGDYPRFCIINPNYSTIQLYQVGHRVYRMNTKSDSLLHFVFGKQACELSILDALSRKSAVMKETTEEQVQAGVVFPCDFESYIEPGGNEVCARIKKFIQIGPATDEIDDSEAWYKKF